MNKKITTRESRALEALCKDAYGRPLLTMEQQLEFANRFKNGDMEALQKLYYFNLRFVLVVAKKYLDKGKTLEELIVAGKYGIEVAAVRYNKQRGVTFLFYMVWVIRKCVQKLVSNELVLNEESNSEVGE